MGKKEIIKKAILKKKKKKWFSVYAPEMFNNIEIGETLISEPTDAMGKVLKINMADLTNDIKKQNIVLSFLANKVDEQKIVSEVYGYELTPSYIKRVIKRAKSKVEDSFVCISKDDIKIRLKPVLVTRTKATGSVLTSLRHKAREYLTSNIKKQTYDELLNSIFSHAIQKGLKEDLKKIYPVSLTEFKIFKKEK